MFSCQYCEIFKNTFFIEHLWWLLVCDGLKLIKLIKQFLFPYISVDQLFDYMGKFLEVS